MLIAAAAACGGDDESAPAERPRGATTTVAASAPPTEAPATTAPTAAPEPEATVEVAEPTEAPASTGGDASAGPSVFAAKGCVACHTISGRNDAIGTIGPNLSLFGSRLKLASATVDNNTKNLAAWLTDPEAIKPGNIMSKSAPIYNNPALELTGDEIDALVAYLQSLK